jgi:pimeloyl-ACP methyl ester carboxylesterase
MAFQHVGIVIVHGVIPQPRYQIQDQTAQALAAELNKLRAKDATGKWVADVLNPPSPPAKPPSPPAGYEARTTITRVHLLGESSYVASDVYDVMEAYWSPLDKNKTNWRSVLSWLLSTIFVPANTTARYMASWQKTIFDLTYVLGAAAIAVGALVLALWIALHSFEKIISIAGTGTSKTSVGLSALWGILGNPIQIGQFLSLNSIGLLACACVGGFTLMEALRAMISVVRQRVALSKIPVQITSRVFFILLLLVISAVLLWLAATLPIVPGGSSMGWWALGFALAALSFEIGRAILESFITDFFGDVQIYTTHDENSEFYALREKILDLVAQTIGGMTAATAADGHSPYQRVHVLAHSLGSTIAMDALMRLYDLKEQGLYDPADFSRIRSFVTFGSSLEKTKYFFDIANPSQSLSYVQWRNDAYGVLFADRKETLDYANGANEGIFWVNYWYFKDPVANAIDSYRSFLVPGDSLGQGAEIRASVQQATKGDADDAVGRIICLNERHPGIINPFVGRFIPHGDYLTDDWFWGGSEDFGTLKIVMSRDAAVAPAPHFANVRGLLPGSKAMRYELMPADEAKWHRDRI